MKDHEICIRTCIACRKKSKKDELIRIVKTPAGTISVDKTYKEPGRGCYLCKNADCIETAYKKKSLNRSLKSNVDVKVYSQLKREIKC